MFPQPPQLVGSVLVSAHASKQQVSLSRQQMVPPPQILSGSQQVKSTHCWVIEQQLVPAQQVSPRYVSQQYTPQMRPPTGQQMPASQVWPGEQHILLAQARLVGQQEPKRQTAPGQQSAVWLQLSLARRHATHCPDLQMDPWEQQVVPHAWFCGQQVVPTHTCPTAQQPLGAPGQGVRLRVHWQL